MIFNNDMDKLTQVCIRRGIRIINDSENIMLLDTAVYYGEMRILFIGAGLSDKSIQAIIDALGGGVAS